MFRLIYALGYKRVVKDVSKKGGLIHEWVYTWLDFYNELYII